MAPQDEPLPFTRDACLRALGLDPSTRHDASSIDRAYRRKLFTNHPDTSGVAGSPESLNRVIHARNMLSSGSFGSRGGGGRYAPSSDGYTPMSDAYSREEFYRWRERRWGGDKADWFVEVPHAGVSVVRGKRALGIGRRVHGHRVHAGVGEAHREETEKGAVPEAESGDGAASRRLSERRIIIGRCCINSSGPSAANAITAPPRQPWRPSPPPWPPSSPQSASPWRCV